MAKREETELGFTRGRVARELRRVLYQDLKDDQVDTILVVLLSHFLVENRLDDLVFQLLMFALPRKTDEKANQEMENRIWKNVQKMPFIRKLQIIEPGLDEGCPTRLRDINRVRNEIFHGKISPAPVSFENKSIWEEDGLENYFASCQEASWRLRKFYDMIDGLKARHEKWAKRLEELGESPF